MLPALALAMCCSTPPTDRVANSGLADSLSALVGFKPEFVQVPTRTLKDGHSYAFTVGEIVPDSTGKPAIGLTKYVLDHWSKPSNAGHSGYVPTIDVQLGDAVLEHEYGHIAAMGTGSTELAQALADIDPNAASSESFADHFQNAFQAIRTHADLSKQDEQTRRIAEALLTQPLFRR